MWFHTLPEEVRYLMLIVVVGQGADWLRRHVLTTLGDDYGQGLMRAVAYNEDMDSDDELYHSIMRNPSREATGA